MKFVTVRHLVIRSAQPKTQTDASFDSKSKRDVNVKSGLVSRLALFIVWLASVNRPASAWLVISNAGGVNNTMQSRTRHYLKATLGLKSPFVSEPSEQLQLLLFLTFSSYLGCRKCTVQVTIWRHWLLGNTLWSVFTVCTIGFPWCCVDNSR